MVLGLGSVEKSCHGVFYRGKSFTLGRCPSVHGLGCFVELLKLPLCGLSELEPRGFDGLAANCRLDFPLWRYSEVCFEWSA